MKVGLLSTNTSFCWAFVCEVVCVCTCRFLIVLLHEGWKRRKQKYRGRVGNKVVAFLKTLGENVLLVLSDTVALEFLETASLADPQLVTHSLDESLVVRDNNNTSLELTQCTRQRINRIHIQMVSRLCQNWRG